MSDDIERLKKKIKEYFCKVIDDSTNDFMSKEDKNVLTYNKDIQKIIDEELAKEPQGDIPVQCVDGSCPMALAEEYADCGMDVVHSCDECQYKPTKDPQECEFAHYKDLAEQGRLVDIETYQKRLIRYIDAGKYRSADKKVFSENDVVYLIEHGVFQCEAEQSKHLQI